MTTILGLDLGVNSVGFAVVRHDEATERGEIVWTGARIFPECREAKDLSPRNEARRGARLARRQLRRRRWRRVHLRRVLAEAGLLPSDSARPPAEHDVYALRARGLTERLEREELGWALFHLLKRRGFQGSRKRVETVGKTKTSKAAKEEEETAQRSEALKARLNGRALSAYLAGIRAEIDTPERRRGVGQTRDMVSADFDTLWRTQQAFHPAVLTDALRERVERIALAQRPTFFRTRTFGQCGLEPEQPRALKGDWLTQQVGMLQLVNALRLEGGNQRGLDAEERGNAVEYLSTVKAPTWKGLRGAMNLSNAAFTQERGKKETVRGNRTEAALRAAIADFNAHPHAQAIREAIGAALHHVEYRPVRGGSILEIRDRADIERERQRLAEQAGREWGLSELEAEALSRIDLPDGTGRHSVRAMQCLLPYLEAGSAYMTAVQAAYPALPSGTPLAQLPGPNAGELNKTKEKFGDFAQAEMRRIIGAIRNPSVLRTLGELQKVVNTLIRVYGKPDLIRLEIARELKQSPEERRETDSRQTKREKQRGAARTRLREMGKAADGDEGADNILRFLLWQEQGGRCPYSGGMIGCADALSAHATEIDHIFPRSRSFDNAQANKVLCLRGMNREKGNLIPYEWLGGDPDRWGHLTNVVWPEMRGAGWPEAKMRRFQKAKLGTPDEDGFTARQLVDTAYIATVAREYLGLLFGGGQAGKDAVQCVPGRATAQVRRIWCLSLSKMLGGADGPKSRDDHRHHAVDALAVALTGPSVIRELSRYWQTRETVGTRPTFAPPWPGLFEDARRSILNIVVSHKVQAKLSGPLHEDTRLGDTGERRKGVPLYVKRKPIALLSAKEIPEIRDAAVRAVIKAVVAAASGDIKAALSREIRLPRKNGEMGPVIRRVRILMPRDSGVMRTHATKNMHAELGPGTSSFIDLRHVDDKVKHAVVTKSAARRVAYLPVPTNVVMRLHPGDVIARRGKNGREYRVVHFFYDNGQIFAFPPERAVVERSGSKMPQPLIAEGWCKVRVDPIGRVSPAP